MLTEHQLDEILRQLTEKGYAVVDAFLSAAEVTALLAEFPETLSPAAVGRGEQRATHLTIRSDSIAWLEPQSGPAVQNYFAKIEQLRMACNRQLYLGLSYFECHFALYQPGQFYQTHLDAFKGKSSRRVSVVSYLNEDWQAQDAGQLCIYDIDEQLLAAVQPNAGTTVIFLSDEFPHEVKPSLRTRKSITGWLRVD